MWRDDGLGGAEERREDDGGVELALLSGPQDAHEDLLRVGAAHGAIAAAAHRARDDRGPHGLLGAPVGGVEVRIHEEAEERGEFDGQVPCEALDLRDGAGVLEGGAALVEQMPPGDVDAVRREGARGAAVAHRKRVM